MKKHNNIQKLKRRMALSSLIAPELLDLEDQKVCINIILCLYFNLYSLGSYMIKEKAIQDVKGFLSYCATPAHERRREDISRFGGHGMIKLCLLFCYHLLLGSGISWKTTIRNFVADNFFQGKKAPSSKTVRRIGLAPNRRAKSSSLFRGEIKARPSTASNNKALKEVHRNAHSCATNVAHCMEFAFTYPDCVQVFSLDDKGIISIYAAQNIYISCIHIFSKALCGIISIYSVQKHYISCINFFSKA